MSNPTILVVDDQVAVRKLLEATLRAEHFLVMAACHGQDALDQLARTGKTPGLALVDLRMPVMDGTHTLVALKERFPHLPVVMMTAVGDTDQRAELVRLGAERTIGKPFDLEQIRTLVADLLANEKEDS